MVNEQIMTALITASALIVTQMIISRKQQRIQDIKNEYIIKEIQNNLKRMEAKQDKHNSLIERVTMIEQDQKVISRFLDEMKERQDRNED